MSELAAVSTLPTYSKLIRSVFIEPIRTVTVVDDEFPTLDDFLCDEPALNDRKRHNRSCVKNILEVCRTQENSWLVDVHDGVSQNEETVAAHLHHSDLMILDYHLEQFSDRGDKSIRILRALAQNAHFNLVIVYTAAGDGPGGDIGRTIAEIALGLSCRNERLKLPERKLEAIQEKLDDWDGYDPSALAKVMEQIDPLTFLRLRWSDDLKFDAVWERVELQALKEIVSSASAHGVDIGAGAVLEWALHQAQEDTSANLSPIDLGKVSFGISDDGINWIRTSTLFVTVISKRVAPVHLPEHLAKALEAWEPLPHRLILSKMRTELDSVGVLAEDDVLSDRYLQAGWLEEFLLDVDAGTAGGIAVDRHWESLGDAVRPKVVAYAHELAQSLMPRGVQQSQRFEGLTHLDVGQDRSLIVQHMNRYACSKHVDGNHLGVGHIFEIGRGAGGSNYWICLSPACDLEPGQKKTAGWAKRLADWVPFKAVELFQAKPEDALREAARANHLFVEIDGELKIFAFAPVSDTGSAALSNPKWEQMFAKNDGVFEGGNRLLTISALSGHSVNGITANTAQARVVAQLRYEYALNLLQRLGTNLSRIGLDFKSYEA